MTSFSSGLSDIWSSALVAGGFGGTHLCLNLFQENSGPLSKPNHQAYTHTLLVSPNAAFALLMGFADPTNTEFLKLCKDLPSSLFIPSLVPHENE